MPDLATLARELQLEQVETLVSIRLRGGHLTVVMTAVGAVVDLVWYKVLHFFLALQSLAVLLFKVNLLVQKLIVEADDAPPKNVVGDFVELLCELVENGRAAFAVESSSVVVHELHFLLSLKLVKVQCFRFLVLGRVTSSFLADCDITEVLTLTYTLDTGGLAGSASWAFSITCLAIIASSEVLKLLLGLFHLSLLLQRLPGLGDTDLAIIADHGCSVCAFSSCSEVLRLLLFIDDSSLLHPGLVVAAVRLLAVFIILVFVFKAHEFLVELEVLLGGAFLEALAAIIDDDDFLGLVVDVHVQDWSVRVDYIGAHVCVLFRVEPFLLQVDVAAAVDKHKTGDRLRQ